MKGDIKLHKEHGLNPTVPICIYCGKDKNEVALLGAAYKEEAPMHMILNNEPCDSCKEKIESKEYIAFLGDCGHNGLIKREAFLPLINEPMRTEIKDVPLIRMEKCPLCLGMIKEEV